MPRRSAALTLRRPPSHWAVPFLGIGLAWTPWAAWKFLPEKLATGPLAKPVLQAEQFLRGYITDFEIQALCGFLSALSALFFIFGLTRIRLSESGVQWEIFPWIWRRWRWATLREIRIDESGRYFEDDEFAKRTLTIVGPGPLGIGTDRLRLTNRIWDRYEDAELATIAVGVPAIADRLMRRIARGRKPLQFPLASGIGPLGLLILLGFSAALTWAALFDPLWNGDLASYRTIPFVAAVVLFLSSFLNFLRKSVGVDRKYLYILRRGWVLKRIPLTELADVETRDNASRIRVWRDEAHTKTREAWKTDTYIHNRGVLLHLLRELHNNPNLLTVTQAPEAANLSSESLEEPPRQSRLYPRPGNSSVPENSPRIEAAPSPRPSPESSSSLEGAFSGRP
jgi:hypothetical protein